MFGSTTVEVVPNGIRPQNPAVLFLDLAGLYRHVRTGSIDGQASVFESFLPHASHRQGGVP